MRAAFTLFLLLLLAGCKKEEIISDENYKKFIGHWRGTDGNDQIDIFVRENGKITTKHNHERGWTFRVNQINVYDMNYPINGDYYRIYLFDNPNKKSPNSISFHEKISDGTIWLYQIFSITEGNLTDYLTMIPLERL